MNTIPQTFNKSERLCSNKIISGLFDNGNIFYNSLFKVVWASSPVVLPSPVQIAFSVSKKGFRSAVIRNLIKRRMREAYRKNKQILYDHLTLADAQIILVIIIKGNSIPDYFFIEKSMKEVLEKLITLKIRKPDKS